MLARKGRGSWGLSIAWSSFTPWSALLGGALIGLAAIVLLLVNGRIAGISGILAGLVRAPGDRAWRLSFVLGLLAAPLLAGLLLPQFVFPAALPPGIQETTRLFAAGLLVGLGTRMANGCTSGHGVCGLARLSLRSLVAVAVFMGAAFGMVFVVRHVLPGVAA
jgi:hypothetical protein